MTMKALNVKIWDKAYITLRKIFSALNNLFKIRKDILVK